MSILLQKAGILTTIQDLGRHRYRRFGINPGGVMDVTATRLINILLGNSGNEAVMEMHFPSPQIVFEANAVAAIGGGDFDQLLDDQPIENWRPFFVKRGSVLRFSNKKVGNRSYLAIKGGFKISQWLGSSSTNLAAKIGGFQGRKLETGDRIGFNSTTNLTQPLINCRLSNVLIPHYRPFPTVRITPGGEFGLLNAKSRDRFLNQDFTISGSSDRMGFRLMGEPLALSKRFELISSAVSFGTIQLLPDGQLIVLMADHQTAGGYPRIAHVAAHDLPLFAQLGAHDKVAFHLIENKDAEDLLLDFEKELGFLRVAIKYGGK